MKKILLAITIFSCFAFAKCNKEKNVLPPDNPYGLPNATQKGANVFACRVNGENWISKKGIYNMGGGVDNDTIRVFGSPKINGYFEDITLVIKGNLVEGNTYIFDSNNYKVDFSTNKTCIGYTGSNVVHLFSISGSLKLTKLDTNRKILSGLFNCIIPIPNCDTLNITDGRFDIQYY
jgi:hypothetical protein